MLKKNLLLLGLLGCSNVWSMQQDFSTSEEDTSQNSQESAGPQILQVDDLMRMVDELLAPADGSAFSKEEVITSVGEVVTFLKGVVSRLEDGSLEANVSCVADFGEVIKEELKKAIKKDGLTYPDCAVAVAEHAFVRTQDRMNRMDEELTDPEFVIQAIISDCDEFVMMAGYSTSSHSVAVISQEDLKKTMGELFPLLEKYEQEALDSGELMENPLSFCMTVMCALDITQHTYTHPELIKELGSFVEMIFSYVQRYKDKQTDLKGVLALLMHERKAVFTRLAYAAPLLEKVIQILFRNLMIPFVCDSIFPDGVDPKYKELIFTLQQTPVVRDLPVRQFFSLVQKLPLESLIKGVRSKGFRDVNQSGELLDSTQTELLQAYSFALPLVSDFFASLGTHNETAILALTSGEGKPDADGKVLLSVSKKAATFPLNDDFFKHKTFRELSEDAQRGQYETIKAFLGKYPELKHSKDEKEQNLLSHAILGYCKEPSAAWTIFTCLLTEEGLTVTDGVLEYLNFKEGEAPDRTARKKDILNEIIKFQAFTATLEQPFYEATPLSEVPSYGASKKNETCSIS